MTHTIRSAYGKKERLGDIGDLGKSLTKQSFTKECDINTILAKYQKTGAIDHLNKNEAQYGFATSDTFQESMQIVAKGNTMFAELPSSIRTKFENDPAKFLDFVQDKNNLKEMQELGLAHINKTNELNEQKTKEPSIPAKTNPEGIAKTEPSGTAKTGASDA